jgi:hypothetical protein
MQGPDWNREVSRGGRHVTEAELVLCGLAEDDRLPNLLHNFLWQRRAALLADEAHSKVRESVPTKTQAASEAHRACYVRFVNARDHHNADLDTELAQGVCAR